MKLYGTTTSPYVRRVRMVATELGLAYELLNTFTPEGQAALRAHTPVWKVPTAVFPHQVIWDSRAICDYLLASHGPGTLRTSSGAQFWRELNLLNVIDGALDSAINVFYFVRDGLSAHGTKYLVKQTHRVESALNWLAGELHGAYFADEKRLGLAEIALISTLDWLTFRDRFEVDSVPELAAFQAAHASRPSVRDTYPTEE